MSQYTPSYKSQEYPEINRKVTTFEYKSVLEKIIEYDFIGFTQDKNSSDKKYIPDFDLSGIPTFFEKKVGKKTFISDLLD